MYLCFGLSLWVVVALWIRELKQANRVDFTLMHLLIAPGLVVRQLGVVRLVVIYYVLVATVFSVGIEIIY